MSSVRSPSPRATAEALDSAFAWGAIDEVRRFFDLLGEHCAVEKFDVDRLTETSTGVVAEGRERGSLRRPSRTVRDAVVSRHDDVVGTHHLVHRLSRHGADGRRVA
jgi:hypothetical protein